MQALMCPPCHRYSYRSAEKSLPLSIDLFQLGLAEFSLFSSSSSPFRLFVFITHHQTAILDYLLVYSQQIERAVNQLQTRFGPHRITHVYLRYLNRME